MLNESGIDRKVVRQLLRQYDEEAKRVKQAQREKNERKYERNKVKQSEIERECEVPENIREYTSGMKIFEEELEVEKPIGPMICSDKIE